MVQKLGVKKARTARRRSPSIEKTTQTKRAILSAATDAFLTNGFSNTRIEDIASSASVAKGLVYVYYPDKLSLFECVVHELAQEPLDNIDHFNPESGESVRSFLLRKAPQMLHGFVHSRRGALLRLVLAEGTHLPAISETYRRLALEPLWNAIRQVVVQAQAAGELRSDALVRFPELLTAPALFGMIGHILGNPRANPPEELFVALVHAFFVEGPHPAERSSRGTGQQQ